MGEEDADLAASVLVMRQNDARRRKNRKDIIRGDDDGIMIEKNCTVSY